MKETPIQLNFLTLTEQDITFEVYRQKFSDQLASLGRYRKKLPITQGGDEYQDFWITLEPADGFERFICSGRDNPYLTLIVMSQSLFQNAVSLSSAELIRLNQEDTFNRRRLSVVTASYPEGKEIVNIDPYYLKSDHKFGFLIDSRFRKNEDTPFSRRVQQLSLSLDKNFFSNRNYYGDKYNKLFHFLRKFRSRLFPLVINDRQYQVQDNLYSLSSHSLRKKTYLFKDDKENSSPFSGLKEYGPVKPIEKEPCLIFIFEKAQRPLANDVYRALIGKTYRFTFPGMEGMFATKIGQQNLTSVPLDSFSKDSLMSCVEKVEKIVSCHKDSAIIGIIIESPGVYLYGTDFSPYFFLKYNLTKRGIPLQAIRTETIKGRDGLKWSASGLGLQIFAKLGGIPWRLKPSNEKCIIFGIGSAHKEDDDGKVVKYFAYSICIDSDGIYKKVDMLSTADDEDSYIANLRRNVKRVISEQLEDGLEKCVIHLPFKIKKREMASIKESVLSCFQDGNKIDCLFIKINTENQFFGYAENNSRVPYESSYIKLAANEYLVWFEGMQYGKENVYRKTGNPVHIKFLDSDNLDEPKRNGYLQDIINLSGANWRGFNAKLSPISIYYPEIIARYIAEFRRYSNEAGEEFDLSTMSIPWFL